MLDARLTRLLGWTLIGFGAALSGVAHAAGTFDSVQGNVVMISPSGNRVAAAQGETIPNGTVVSTGDGAQAVLKFDDGGAVVLNQNTEFRLVDYRYDAAKPDAGRSVFDFLKGAARFVTGLIARAEPANYKLRTKQMTIGVRGTDFSVASGSLTLSVTHGVVTGTNAAGTVAFGPGQFGFAPNAGTLPTVIGAGQLPPGVANAFARLGAVPLPAGTLPPAPGGAAGGAGAATGAAAEGGASGTVLAIGAGAALLTGAAAHHADETTTHH